MKSHLPSLIMMLCTALGLSPAAPRLAAQGTTAATVTATIAPSQTTAPWVGQRITFTIDVSVVGRFSGPTLIDLPKIPGAILMQPSERAIPSSREENGVSFTVLRYEFALFSQRAGPLTVPEIPVRCTSLAASDQPPQSHLLHTAPFTVTTVQPDGFDPSQITVATTNLTLTEAWNPSPGTARVGAAFQRTITVQAADFPGMMLPSLAPATLEGLRTYSLPPEVQDHTERGELTGMRRDGVTYVCETPGHHEIPAVQLRWWDVTGQTWVTASLPAVTLEVAPRPSSAANLPAKRTAPLSPWGWIGAGLAALAALAAGLWHLQSRFKTPEQTSFRLLLAACRQDHAPEVYRCYLQWESTLAAHLGSAPPSPLDNPTCRTDWLALQNALIQSGSSWKGAPLASSLKQHRRNLLKHTRANETRLAPLNPQAPA